MNSLLVTGAAGFIGANFVHYWLRNYPQDRVVGFDALTYAGNKGNLAGAMDSPHFCFRHGDICDQEMVESLLRLHSIDTVVHFAAESHVDRSITGPDTFIQTNVVGTHSLLKAAKCAWLEPKGGTVGHRFHHVSTDEVYGALTADEPAFTEETLYRPNSPYSASKAASDHLVRAYHHTYGLQVSTSNCSNNYGPFHFPEKLIPLVMTNILRNESLPVYGDGRQIRDWLYVEDHCYGIDLVLKKGRIGESYNFGGNNEWSNISIVRTICALLDDAFSSDAGLAKKFPSASAAAAGESDSLITFVEDRLGHDRRYAVDASKATRELGYVPRESFATGIRKTLAWYLKNENWWLDLLARARPI